MKSTYKCIYSYYETLLGIWNSWNDGVLYGQFPEGANSFTEALGIDTSDGRSRAKEIYRIGLLKQELTKGTSGLEYISKGNNIQSDLGFVSAIISKAAIMNRTIKIDKALSALCAIFSIVQSVKIDNIEFSINTLIQRLEEAFPCPKNIDFRKWHRYLLSAFICETKYREEKHISQEEKEKDSKSFVDFFTGCGICPSLTIRLNEKNGYTARKTIHTAKDVSDAITERVSLTNIIQQKSALFVFGDENDVNPKGFYGMAIKYNSDFLHHCYEVEKNDIVNSPFLKFYDEDSQEPSKCNVLKDLVDLFNQQNDIVNLGFQKIMKTIYEGAIDALEILNYHSRLPISTPQNAEDNKNYLAALQTKPFMLLAGISGTGKSRLVREFAFKSCPSYLQDKDQTTPGNFCMIEVKPNWHDSTELLGYYSNLNQKYIFTKFVRFLVKAMMYPNVPFFVCLDEMNLAPVEQYFAELLSVIETRKKVGARIETGRLVEPQYFSNLAIQGCNNNSEVYMKLWETVTEENMDASAKVSTSLVDKGLTLPDNVFIIGTVNMDDTTHQFSRKVIDRAMTIEMNGGNLADMFGGSRDLEYYKSDDDVWPLETFKPRYVNADEVIRDCQTIVSSPEHIKFVMGKDADGTSVDGECLPKRLKDLNSILENTPFQVSYRVFNELVIYLGVLLDKEKDMDFDNAVDTAVDQILLMKVLPRIEGDEDMFRTADPTKNRLQQMMDFVGEESQSYKKLDEMNKRLSSGFTRFWP